MSMIRYAAAGLLAACSFAAGAQTVGRVTDPVEWVNPLMGTASKPELSNGNTYPAIAVPWGMNFWTPQTGKMGNGWAYTYDADKIRGFKQTHQPSPWMNDYGQFAVMPVTGSKRFTQEARASWFSHKAEVAKPYYYSVYLADADVTTEIAPTERAAQFRFTFPKSDASYVVVDAFDKGSYVKILPGQRRVIGYSTRHARGPLPKNFRNYFVIEFDQPFTSTDTWQGEALQEGRLETEGAHSGALLGFTTAKGQKVHMRVASSFIGFEQAELNLRRELGQDDFDATRAKGKALWNGVLGKLAVEGGSVDQTRTFYSSLYRMVLFPNKMYEIDAFGKPVHWSPYNGEVLPGRLFAGTGFWDTFRALYPFLNLVYPSINREMQEGLANAFKEGGWLPEWSSPGYANVMIGNNSASVVADAWIKGVRGQDIETLWQALKHGADNEGPMQAVGRAGVKYYNELGYVPYDVGINENAARTLEYAYDDFTIYQLGKALGKPAAEIDIYAQRSMNYRKLFDQESGLMRGKNRDGSFQSPFNPFKWGDAFTEGNSWHYSWSVFHDVAGLAELMGGRKAFVDKLDTVFTLPPIFDESYYKAVIHEIREMQIANMGQYAHGNQPIQHMTYLYNYAGAPWKAQYWIRETMDRMYAPTPDGYCGDEDNGQTSAWYVFSALGFYPVTPGVNQYVIGTPLFPKASVQLENGRSITLRARGAGRYIDALRIDGKTAERNWVGHGELMQGATLDFSMSTRPNTGRGIRAQDAPYSFSRDEKP
ncbi:GH92 family glycosyl hydrolase [Massilia yuzhufengensis]|uniref:Alpha-1,2-mannosidase, putative n=1 Tax=Massilia yuzhufengensis TaxID=1164594 RepID=A0A1I1PXX9_9BURK|nr:GH92 family glycosyl hydrolase [Massilia yuzhufengensis]SFD14744.1 alpha-1,2-mannosidase, putative [Massilia yuzhufengensis]